MSAQITSILFETNGALCKWRRQRPISQINSITLAGSKLARSWFAAGSELVRSWSGVGSKLVAGRLQDKFHHAVWFEACSELVQSWSQTGSKLVADRFEAKFHYAI